jgi:hypothetical protein
MVIEGTIPVEFIVVLLELSMNPMPVRTPTAVAAYLEYDLSAVKQVFHYLKTGQIVTEDGEIVAEIPMAENLERSTPNLPTEPQASKELTPTWIKERMTEMFPTHRGPTTGQIEEMLDCLEGDAELFEDVLYLLDTHAQPVSTPPTFACWWLREKTPEEIREEVEIRKSQNSTESNVIQQVIRESERKMKHLTPAGATPDRTQRLRERREKLSG